VSQGLRGGPSVTLRLPHPFVLLLATVAVAAAATWVAPAGEYERRDDPTTGRRIVVAGTFHRVDASPVGPFRAAVAVARGFVEGADVIAVVLFVGGAWVIVERLGTLTRAMGRAAWRFRHRGLLLIPVVSVAFATMGGIENMQEEIIPLVPVLLLLGTDVGIDAVSVVSMSAGAAMIGSAFSPANPFQTGIATRVAQLPQFSDAGLRMAMFVAGLSLWIAWTMVHASRRRGAPAIAMDGESPPSVSRRDVVVLIVVLLPMAAYIYGALRLDWGFNELSGAFFIAAWVAGLIGGLGIGGTSAAYLEGMQALLPAAMLIGIARAISVVLADGRIIDSLLHALASPLAGLPAPAAALLMVPVQSLVHVPVSSVSGQAVLTMPILVPLADLLGYSRQVTVLAYQTGAGLMELLTPTNGALMAILLAAGVPYDRWLRFAIVGWVLATAVGVVGILAALWHVGG
jgi:uncharacterized ion transporter superfamily protein YfcC